jgi:P27 family predicted phage terminase small subunit
MGKNIQEHLISGTFRADRHHRVNGEAIGLPEPPEHLSEDERVIFVEVCGMLQADDCLTNSDLFIIELFAVQLSLHRQAKKELQDGKLVSMHTNKNGSTNPVASPWVAIIQKSSDQLLKLSAKLGLNVVDRSKQTKTEVKQKTDSLLK